MNVSGTLNIEGSVDKPVIITDQRDDNFGSPLDFNQDGTVTQNYGRYNHTFVNFNPGSAGTLQHLILKSNGYGVNITGASPVMRNVLFDNLGRGVAMTGVGSAPVIENSVFNNTTYPLETSMLCFPASLDGNTFSGTSYRGIKIPNETLNQNAVLSPRPFGALVNAPYIFENFVVDAELTIEPGVKCKFLDSRGMTVNRWLKAVGTAEQPVVFTSIRDDFYGGDTNADSVATTATGSLWNGITFADATIDADCILKNVIVKNAHEAITANNASPTIENVTFYSNRNAVQATGASNPVIRNCDFVGQSQRAINNVNQSFVIQAENCWWGSVDGPVVAASPSGSRQAISLSVNAQPVRTVGLNQPLIGDVSANGQLQAYDASLTLQAAVSLIELEPHQLLAADASGDGEISAFDALLILEYVAGLRPNVPAGLKAPANQSNAVLVIGSGELENQNELWLPIALNDVPASAGVDVVIAFNPALLKAEELRSSTQSNFMQSVRIDNAMGRIYIAAASTLAKSDEKWNEIRFSLRDAINGDFQTEIRAESFRVNEQVESLSSVPGTVAYRVPTGINEPGSSTYLQCYPNPAKDVLYLSGVEGNAEVSIYNVSGQKVLTSALQANRIDVGTLDAGVYYVAVQANGVQYRAKFLKY